MKRFVTVLLLGLLCVTGQAQEAFSRGFAGKNKIFIPKGSVGGGLSVSFSNNGVGDDTGFSILPSYVGEIKGGWLSFAIHPSAEFFLKDNWSVGLSFDYVRNIFSLDTARLSLSEDLALNIQGWNYHRQSYTGAIMTRYYVPFMGSRIFGWFVEGSLNGGFIQSKLYSQEENGLKHGTYQENLRFSIGLHPGVCFFVAENFDFEVQVGLINLSMTRVNQVENQVKTSSAWRFSASEKIDLLAIKFGAHAYFPIRKKK